MHPQALFKQSPSPVWHTQCPRSKTLLKSLTISSKSNHVRGLQASQELIGFLLGQLSWPSGLNYATLSRLGLESFLILIALGILFSLRSIPITYEWQWGLRGKISFFSFSFHVNLCFPLLPTRVEASYASPRGLVNRYKFLQRGGRTHKSGPQHCVAYI